MYQKKIFIRYLGIQPYEPILQAMHKFTNIRNDDTPDEIWLLEHYPIFTQGQSGKAEHMLVSCNIPVIQSDRGGQITYHGPGQQLMYVLLNLKRRKLSIRKLLTILEQTVINTLSEYGISSYSRIEAPGVYVEEAKICSIGLRIRKGCSLHGFALNINMDLTPFLYINPCGYSGMKITQMCYWIKNITTNIVSSVLIRKFLECLNNSCNEQVVI